MRKLDPKELRSTEEYERTRGAFRAFVTQLKQHRRVELGPLMSLVFENRRTLLYQLQEQVRLDGGPADTSMEDELARVNELLGGTTELNGTLFLELKSPGEAQSWLPRLVGIERCIALEIRGGIVVRGEAEPGRGRDELTSTVHYLRFPFPETAVDALTRGKGSVRLLVDHARYQVQASLGTELVRELLADLADRDGAGDRRDAPPVRSPRPTLKIEAQPPSGDPDRRSRTGRPRTGEP